MLLKESFAEEFSANFFGGRFLRSSLTGCLSDFEMNGPSFGGAMAVELVHTASLLHDDVIDGAFFRRHAPTFWHEKGTSASILAGDYLVTLAFEQLFQSNDLDLCRRFTASLKNVCSMEARQELEKSQQGSFDEAVAIASGKTGELFGFAACASSSNLGKRELLYNAGLKLGTAYQLADDMADAFGHASELGKPVGNDAKSGKLTIVTAGASVTKIKDVIELQIEEALNLFAMADKKIEAEFYLQDVFTPALEKLVGAVNEA